MQKYVLRLETTDGQLVDVHPIECRDEILYLVVQEQLGESNIIENLVCRLRTLKEYPDSE